MLKIQGYDVYFTHKPNETGTITGKLNGGRIMITPYQGFTRCIITREDGKTEENPTVVETAYCSISDKFDKAVGRKVSLGRVLKNFPKEFRTEVWKAYIKETSRL